MTELRQKINNIVEEKNTKVVPENIRAGRTIFDVEGIFSSDANAIAADILKDKTAYVNGEKIEGTYEPLDTSDATATAADIMKDKTAYVNGEKIVGTHEDTNGGGESEYNSLCSNESNLTNFALIKWIAEISSLDLAGVTDMKNAFSGANDLKSIGSLLNTENITTLEYAFRYCYALKQLPLFDTSSVINMTNCFYQCSNITEIPQLNTMNVENFTSCFNSCANLETIPLLDMGNTTRLSNAFNESTSIKNIGGFKDLGKAYTQQSVNYSYYSIGLSACLYLTHDSLMNIINNLYDLNLTYDVANGGTLYTQLLNIGTTNLAKLTAEEIRNSDSKAVGQ